jgi:cell division protein FtsW
MIQMSHASTTLPREAFIEEMREQLIFRLGGVALLFLGMWLGPRRVEPLIPALTVFSLAGLILVFVPGFEQAVNGSHRWIRFFGRGPSIQPSEIARVVFVLWVARRCVLLDDRVENLRTGFIPTLAFGLLATALILKEPDLGGALLFLLCFGTTLFVGGARMQHVALVIAACILLILIALNSFGHVAERFAVWMGDSSNDQVTRAAEAMASGDWFGVGFGQGGFRNAGLQYMQTDYALALVGEELGLYGIWLVVGLFGAFIWNAQAMVLGIKDRFAALCAFGLSISVAFQAMVHLQVVTGLAPPKGMALPFLSDGGSALLAACLAVGLALGAARAHSLSPPTH